MKGLATQDLSLAAILFIKYTFKDIYNIQLSLL